MLVCSLRAEVFNMPYKTFPKWLHRFGAIILNANGLLYFFILARTFKFDPQYDLEFPLINVIQT